MLYAGDEIETMVQGNVNKLKVNRKLAIKLIRANNGSLQLSGLVAQALGFGICYIVKNKAHFIQTDETRLKEFIDKLTTPDGK